TALLVALAAAGGLAWLLLRGREESPAPANPGAMATVVPGAPAAEDLAGQAKADVETRQPDTSGMHPAHDVAAPKALGDPDLSVHGVVVDDTGTPIGKASVAFVGMAHPVAGSELVLTDAAGEFTLAAPRAGSWKVVASAAGHEAATPQPIELP